MFSAFELFLLASCLSISGYVCNTNAPIANQLCFLAVQLRQMLRLDPPGHNRHCRRATDKSRKRHRLRVTFGSLPAQCLCPRKAPVRQGPARKDIRDAGATGTRISADGSSATEIAPNEGTARGSKYPWIVVRDLIASIALLALTHLCGTKLRTAGQSPIACIIAACNFAQWLAIFDEHFACFTTCAPSRDQSKSANPSSSPASKRNGVQKNRPTSDQGQPRKSKKQNNSVPATGQSSRGAEDGNGILWACLFHKFDPDAYRPCGGLTLSDWSAVLQHLTRAHTSSGTYCPTCWTIFATEGQWDEHIRAQACESRLGPDEFDDKEMTSLKQKMKWIRGATDERKWFWFWSESFSGHPKPSSPYICSHTQETADLLRRRPANAPTTVLQDVSHAGQDHPSESFLAALLAADPSLSSRPLRRHPGARPDTTTAAPTLDPAPQDLLAGLQQTQPATETVDSSPIIVVQGAEDGSPLCMDPSQLQNQQFFPGDDEDDLGFTRSLSQYYDYDFGSV